MLHLDDGKRESSKKLQLADALNVPQVCSSYIALVRGGRTIFRLGANEEFSVLGEGLKPLFRGFLQEKIDFLREFFKSRGERLKPLLPLSPPPMTLV